MDAPICQNSNSCFYRLSRVGILTRGASLHAKKSRRRSRRTNEGVARLRKLGFDPVAKLVRGRPAEEIGNFAREVGADLIVVSYRRQSAFDRWWSGPKGAYLMDSRIAVCSWRAMPSVMKLLRQRFSWVVTRLVVARVVCLYRRHSGDVLNEATEFHGAFFRLRSWRLKNESDFGFMNSAVLKF